MGEFAQGAEKAHHLKNKKIKNFAIREAGEGNQDTKEDSQHCRIKKEDNVSSASSPLCLGRVYPR